MDRTAKGGTSVPCLSQIDKAIRLYPTGKQQSHAGREQGDRTALISEITDLMSPAWSDNC